MNSNFSSTKENMNLVLQAYYSLDFIGNCTLALNKAHWISVKSFNLYENFQIFKCKEITKEVCKVSSTTYEFFKYFNQFNKLKKLDFDFCVTFSRLKSVILTQKPDLQDYSSIVDELATLLRKLTKKYENLVGRFPESSELKEMFRSFLIKILKDSERAGDIIHLNNKKYLKNLKFGCLSLKNQGILVLSGNFENPAKIVFASKAFLKLTGYSNSAIQDQTLNLFVPRLLDKLHLSHLPRYAAKSKTHNVFPLITLFFVDSSGFIIECSTHVECICVNSVISFIAFINPLRRSREYALVSKEGFIHEHSKDFPKLLNCERTYVKDLFIQEFLRIDDLSLLEDRPTKTEIRISSNWSEFKFVIATCKDFSLKSTSLYIFYLTQNISESYKWNSTTDFFKVNEMTEAISEKINNRKSHILQISPGTSLTSRGKEFRRFELAEQKMLKKSRVFMRITKFALLIMVRVI
jgi:hypothetical protein